MKVNSHGTRTMPLLVDSTTWFLHRLHSYVHFCPEAQENCFHSDTSYCNLSSLSILSILLGAMWYLIMVLMNDAVKWTRTCVYWPLLSLCEDISDSWYMRKFQSGLMLAPKDKCCYLHPIETPKVQVKLPKVIYARNDRTATFTQLHNFLPKDKLSQNNVCIMSTYCAIVTRI